ncbi:proline racemase family protein [Pseudonocardia halophobica]|uniref:Proline racemase n=1 Tax=Pseudonocardia halophobica TaxID=29401 RepID=A0A9W6NUR1_9PSEU|nr:proline racemase family protein [Pseudonocardia halophobica]GLL09716.1 proline racemase [Pseudonocardia halophobica]
MSAPPSPGPRTITSIDVHCEGEVGRVLPGVHLLVRGRTWSERMRWCETELDWLRRLLLREPRGHPSMCGVLVLPPLDPTADVGIVILEQGGFRPMSGANTMCTVTALLETGSLPSAEPETVVRIDTAVGPVEATAGVEGGRVRWVRVRNVPSFAIALDRKISVPEYGTVAVDVAFGGQVYVMARAADLGVALGPEHAPAITRAGTALLAAAREQVPVAHPDRPGITTIDLAMLHGPPDSPDISGRNSVVMPSGRIVLDDPASWAGILDRSPGGTGTSARMAVLHARGELGLGVPFVHQGVLGTTFRGVLHERTTVGRQEAVVPSIQGRAWITGHVQHVLQPDDPFPTGLTVGDIWSPVQD